MSWVWQGLRESLERSKQISGAHRRFNFGHVGEGLNTSKMVPAGERLNKGSMTFVFQTFILKPHNSVFVSICFWYLLSYCPSAEAHDECLQASESMCGPFRRYLDFWLPSISPGQLEFPLLFKARFCRDISWH